MILFFVLSFYKKGGGKVSIADIVEQMKGEATHTSKDAEKILHKSLHEVLKSMEGKSLSEVFSLIKHTQFLYLYCVQQLYGRN